MTKPRPIVLPLAGRPCAHCGRPAHTVTIHTDGNEIIHTGPTDNCVTRTENKR